MIDYATFDFKYLNTDTDEYEITEATVCFDYRPARTYGPADNWSDEELTVESIQCEDSPYFSDDDIEDYFYNNFFDIFE